MARAALLLGSTAISAIRGDGNSEQNPVVVLDLFQVADLSAMTTLQNVDVSDVGDAVHWVHTEIVTESLRDEKTSETSRISSINGIASFRFKVRNPQAILEETRHSLLSDFGPYTRYSNGQSKSHGMPQKQASVGAFVGLRRQLDARFPLPPDSPIFRVSIPGPCPEFPEGEKFTDNGEPEPHCQSSYGSVEGGLCSGVEDTTRRLPAVDPDGSKGCTYAYGTPVSVHLDDLVGIKQLDCGGELCVDWVDFRFNCTDANYKRKFNAMTGAVEDYGYCVEYDIHPDCIDGCDSDACAKLLSTGQDVEVGLAFWRGRCDAAANRLRVEQAYVAFSVYFTGYNTTKLLVDEELLAAPAPCHRPESPKACSAHGPSGGPYCFRGFSGMCQPCYVPNAFSTSVFRNPVCPFAALKTPEYLSAASGFVPLKCSSNLPIDLCCLYNSSDSSVRCVGEDDPDTAAFDDTGFTLVAARQSTDDMVTFFTRVAGEVLGMSATSDLPAWAAEQWGATPRFLNFTQAVSEVEKCCVTEQDQISVVALGIIIGFLCLLLLAAIPVACRKPKDASQEPLNSVVGSSVGQSMATVVQPEAPSGATGSSEA